MNSFEDNYHPIIDKPWQYQITEVRWQASPDDEIEPCLDVTFCKENEVRRLRFLSPEAVEIRLNGSPPQQSGEMCIRDIRRRGFNHLKVQVTDFGASGSPIYLWARKVVDLDSGEG